MRGSWKYVAKKNAAKRKRPGRSRGSNGLEDKVDRTGGRSGFGLEVSSNYEEENELKQKKPGLYGNRSVASSARRVRLFQTPASRTQNQENAVEAKSNFSFSSKPSMKNPYKEARPGYSSTAVSTLTAHPRRGVQTGKRNCSSAVHVVCAISENLARETCVASLDAGSPVSLHITKQGNGQTYAETLAYLEVLQPHEVLLNEGRRNSQLTSKILELYKVTKEAETTLHLSKSQRRKAQADRKTSARRGRIFAKNVSSDQQTSQDGTQDTLGPSGTSVVVKFVPRSYFDQTKGAEMLGRLSRKDTYDSNVVEEYILLSSSHAVLQYTSLCLGANFSPSCLELNVNSGGNNRMTIDRSSILHLELLANRKTGKIANSLIGTVDCTKTTVGSRLLRTNLMAPPLRTDTINARLDLVDTMLEDEAFFYTVMSHLQDFPDIDKMLTNVALVPWKKNAKVGAEETEVTARIASKGISALVCIKSILSAIPAFAGALEDKLKALDVREGAQRVTDNADKASESGSTDDVETEETNSMFDTTSTVTGATSLLIGLGGGRVDASQKGFTNHHLLRAILVTMKNPALAEVLSAVTDIFTESTTFTRNAHAMRHQECFALKANGDGMMDVIRKAFLGNVDDIYHLADEYAKTHEMSVTVKETTSRGYYLSVPADAALDLPAIFIQPVKRGRFIHCTTEQVHSLNARSQENIQDLLLITHDRIQEVLDVARSRYDALASLSDAVALLDMCHCFADNVASSRLPWCRPLVSDGPTVIGIDNPSNTVHHLGSGGDIAIRKGRYGIDVKGTGLMVTDENSPMVAGDFIPNDTFASEYHNFTVVTGINGSGKTLYLKQIAIIVVLAHCGSYVPAEEAFLPVRDRLCTRIGTSDDQEHNISTFMLEMKETAFICNNASEKSLILVDELGRATSNEDGVAVTWAVSEFLLEKRSMAFFVTHYPQLAMLSNVYQTAQNQHMSASISGNDEVEIKYTYKIQPGPCRTASDYGVEMSATCGWPTDVVAEARTLRKEIEQKLPEGSLCHVEPNAGTDLYRYRRKAEEALHALSNHLVALKQTGSHLSSEAKRNYLQDLRLRLIPSEDLQLIDGVKSILHDEPLPPLPLPSERRPVHPSFGENHKYQNSQAQQLSGSAHGTVDSAVEQTMTHATGVSKQQTSGAEDRNEMSRLAPTRDAIDLTHPVPHESAVKTKAERQVGVSYPSSQASEDAASTINVIDLTQPGASAGGMQNDDTSSTSSSGSSDEDLVYSDDDSDSSSSSSVSSSDSSSSSEDDSDSSSSSLSDNDDTWASLL